MDRLIDPAIADLQHEYDAAIRQGQVWRARYARVAGYLGVWKVVLIAGGRDALFERTAADDRAVVRTVVCSLVAVSALTALLVLPVLRSTAVRLSGADTASWLVLYSVPSALVVALPLGLVFGILLGLRNRASTTRVKWTVTALGILCSAAAFIIIGWSMPATNQAFRELVAGRRLLRGFNELTLGELASGDPVRVMRLVSGGVTVRRLAWEFHFRIALAFAPLTLGLFSLGATAARRREYGLMITGMVALTTSFGYYMLLFNVREGFLHSEWLPPMAAAWAPNLVMLAVGLLLCLRPPAAPRRNR